MSRVRLFIIKHDKKIYRLLEILPGFVSWNIILFPYWGIFIIPDVVAYFILAYNIYWFYQSLTIAITATLSHWRIQASMVYDWVEDLKSFPDWKQVHNVIIVTTYKEPLHILRRTFNSIAKQALPLDQISVCLAMEKKEAEEDRQVKVKALKKEFGKKFANLFITVHELIPGEAVGKASNERFAAIWIKEELVDKRGKNIDYIIITSCDADHTYHPKHFAALTFKYLDDPARHLKFFQPAIMFYNNIWNIPAITRVPNTLGSIWNLSQLPRKDKLINQQNSFQLKSEN